MSAPRLVLYHRGWCGFCIRVRREAEQLGIELELVDVDRDAAALSKLMRARGRGTVPVLGIFDGEDERLMGESRDIIDYLRELSA